MLRLTFHFESFYLRISFSAYGEEHTLFCNILMLMQSLIFHFKVFILTYHSMWCGFAVTLRQGSSDNKGKGACLNWYLKCREDKQVTFLKYWDRTKSGRYWTKFIWMKVRKIFDPKTSLSSPETSCRAQTRFFFTTAAWSEKMPWLNSFFCTFLSDDVLFHLKKTDQHFLT